MLYLFEFKFTSFLCYVYIYSLLGIESDCDCLHGMNHCLSCNLLIAGDHSSCGFCELGTIRPSFIMAAFGEESLAGADLELCKECFAVSFVSDRDKRREIRVKVLTDSLLIQQEARDREEAEEAREEARDERRAAQKKKQARSKRN